MQGLLFYLLIVLFSWAHCKPCQSYDVESEDEWEDFFYPSVVIEFDPGCVCLNINTRAEARIVNSNYSFPLEIYVIGVKSKGMFEVFQFIVRLRVILSAVNLFFVSSLCQGCTQLHQKASTVSTLRGTATLVLMRPKPATSTAAARGSAPPTSLPAARRTPTRVKPAARSAATKRLGCSWIACPLSSATGCSSAPARVKVAQNDAGRRLCLIAPIKIRRSPTVWSYGRSAARTLSAGAGTGNGGGEEGRGAGRRTVLWCMCVRGGRAYVQFTCMHVCVCALLFSWHDGQILVPCRHRHLKTHNHLLVFMQSEKKENWICAFERINVWW